MRTNFQMEYQNITMIKGDTVMFNVVIFDDAGNAVEVDEAYFTCKKNPETSNTLFQKRLNSGIIQEDKLMVVRIAPNDTQNADVGNYYYDLQLVIGDDVFTALIGTFTIEQDVTN